MVMTQITPEAMALLETISGPESAGNYNVMYGGGLFDGYNDHPRQAVEISSGPNKGRTSSAAGKYQFLAPTWDDISGRYNLPDFSPKSQDTAAWVLAQEEYKRDTGRDLQNDLASGDISRVPGSLKNQWTSLPGGIEQGITGSAFQNAYSSNMGLNLNSNPAVDAIAMATSGVAPGNPGAINMATNRPASEFTPKGERLPPIVPAGVAADNVGGMPTWNQMAELQGKPAAKQGILGGVFDGISIPKIDIPGALASAGDNIKKMVTSDPRLMIGAARDFAGAKAEGALRGAFTPDRLYKGVTLGYSPVSGGTRVSVNDGKGSIGWLTNPNANKAFDAEVHSGQNMDVYRANVLAKQSGAPSVSLAPRQVGEAPNGMSIVSPGKYQDSSGGIYYERNLSGKK